MATDNNYYYVKWSAYAEIEDERVEISSFRIRYALNEIPVAEFWPVVGIDVRSGTEAKSLEALLDAQPYTPVKIYMKGETEEDSPQAPDEPGFTYGEDMLIFDGFYQGVIYQSGRSPAGGTVSVGGSASGWLTGLVGTTPNTMTNTLKGPGGFAEVANVGFKGAKNPYALFNMSNAFTVGAEQAVQDLWKEFIKPFFLALVDTESVWGEDDNDSARDALDRMDDEAAFESEVKLPFEDVRGDVDPKIMGEWLGANVAFQAYNRWRNGSIWSALLGMADDFTFRVVPLIDTATCAPIFGALGGDPYMIIKPNEYFNINMRFDTPELITKLIVISGSSAFVSAFAGESVVGAIIGQASSEDAWAGSSVPVRGKTIRIMAPTWLATEPSIGRITRFSLGKTKFAIPDAVNPDAFQLIPDKDEDYQQIYNNYLTSETGDAYAKTKLMDIMLAGRHGSVDGRFRLDISPGSTIAVEIIGGSATGGKSEPKYAYGLVERVELYMDTGRFGGSGNAHTAFELTNVRTGQEQTGYEGTLTESEHPIFKSDFRGAKLWTEE